MGRKSSKAEDVHGLRRGAWRMQSIIISSLAQLLVFQRGEETYTK